MIESNLDKERPPRWREGKLFPFIEDCWNNSLAIVANYNIPAGRLSNIDALFDEVHDKLAPKSQQYLIPALLLLRSYSAFRAAVMTALCLPTDSFPLQRSCLETAGYSQLMASTKGLAERWLQRDDDAEVKRLFTNRAVRDAIAAKDPPLAEIYQGLYERTIDFGAHPNEKSVLLNLVKESVRTNTLQMRLLSGPGIELEHALRTCSQIGVCSLKIFSLIFPETFEPLRERIESASKPF